MSRPRFYALWMMRKFTNRVISFSYSSNGYIIILIGGPIEGGMGDSNPRNKFKGYLRNIEWDEKFMIHDDLNKGGFGGDWMFGLVEAGP